MRWDGYKSLSFESILNVLMKFWIVNLSENKDIILLYLNFLNYLFQYS